MIFLGTIVLKKRFSEFLATDIRQISYIKRDVVNALTKYIDEFDEANGVMYVVDGSCT